MTTSAGAYPVWRMLLDARAAAGLTQRDVARRAGTSQSAVHRYETARTLPDIPTLHRLLHACGQRLLLDSEPIDPAWSRQLDESLALTPIERVQRVHKQSELTAAASTAWHDGRVRRLSP
ncbi:MAG: helix-turn-helix domain-containing protein [Egibacteraceae bacterium]